MHEDYIRPQENGSHADCDYVKLTSKEQSVTVVSPHSFSFSVSPYTQEELTRKAHHFELERAEARLFAWITPRMESDQTAVDRNLENSIAFRKSSLYASGS